MTRIVERKFLLNRKYYQPPHDSEILDLSSSTSGAEMDRNTHDHLITLISSRQILVGNIFCSFYFVLLFSKDNEIFVPIAICPNHNAFNSENIGGPAEHYIKVTYIVRQITCFNMKGFKRL